MKSNFQHFVMLLSLCSLCLVGLAGSGKGAVVFAQPTLTTSTPSTVTTLPAPATDTHTVLESGTVVAVNNVGDTIGFTTAGAERVMVMVFELPASPPDTVVSGVIGPDVNSVSNPRGGAPYQVELSVLGVRDSKDVLVSDFDAPATLIQTDFLNPAQPSNNFARVTPSASGSVALTTYLQSNYAAGKFIFLRFKVPAGTTAQDFDNDNDLYSGYNVSTAGHFNAARLPSLSISFLTCTDRVYVDANAGGANNGSNWNDAFQNLQDALAWKNVCPAAAQIWVADGVYFPDEGGGQSDNDRSAAFRLLDGVAIYGGFAGGENDVNQRDPATNVAVLSGDLAQDDVNNDGNRIAESWTDLQGDNTHHVLLGDNLGNSALLDGFTITGGHTDGGGGGMLLTSADATLNQLIFSGNQARDGGGLYSFTSSPQLSDVTFRGNRGTAFGGGMSTRDAGTAVLNTVVFDGNEAGDSGGAMDNNTSSPTLTNVTFRNNQAGALGGAVNIWISTVQFAGVTFENNRAGKGGGARQGGNSTASFTNVTFSGNQATQEGGALYVEEGPVNLRNVTLAANSGPTGSALTIAGGSLDLTNTLIDAAGQARACSGTVSSLGFNLSTDSSCQLTKSTDLVRVAPKLGPLADNGGPTQTRALLNGSGAVDKGDCSAGAVTTDQRGISRPQGAACDIGAFEFTGPITYDYGDAPDPTYPTLQANKGPRHGLLSSRKLGASVDAEADGQPTANADGDGGDDDGVTLPAELKLCQANPITVAAGAEGRLFAWADFNGDGDWSDPGEKIFNSLLLPAGNHSLDIFIPCTASITDNGYLRFRFSGDLKLRETGTALDGEVEDYRRPIRRGPPNAGDDFKQGLEDTPLSIPVLDNDSDPPGSISLDSIDRQASNGVATVDGATVRFVPKPNWFGMDSFEYAIRNDIGLTDKATVQVLILSVNDPPTDISLSNDRVDALQPLNTPVGTVSVTDEDTGDSHTIQLSGLDASAFALNGSSLNRARYYNPAKKSTYAVTLSATDNGGASFAKDFTISIFAAEPIGPRDLKVSPDSVDENKPADTLVGTLSATDPRGLNLSYSLVNGPGDAHNSLFRIDGNQLKTTKEIDFETIATASTRMQVTNGVDDPVDFVLLVKIIDDPNEPPALPNCTGQDIQLITSNDNQTEVTIRAVQVANATSAGCEVTGKLFVRIPGGSQASDVDFKGRVDRNGRLQSNDSLLGDTIGKFKLDPAGPEVSFSGTTIEYYADRPSLRSGSLGICLPDALGGGCIPLPATNWLIDSSGLNFGGTSVGNSSLKLPMPSMALRKSGVGITQIFGNYKRVANGYEFTAGGTFGIPRFTPQTSCGITVIVTIYKDSSGIVNVRLEPATIPMAEGQINVTRLSELTLGYSCKPGIPIGTTGLELVSVLGTISLRPDNTFITLSVGIATTLKVGPLPAASVTGSTTVFITPEWGLDLSVSLKLLSLIELANASASVRKDRFSTRFSFNAFIIYGEAGTDIWTTNGTKLHFTGRGSVSVRVPKGSVAEVCVPYPCVTYCHNPRGWKPWHCHFGTCTKCASIPPFELGTPTVGADFGEFTNGAWGFKGYGEIASKQFGFYVDTEKNLKIGGVDGYTLATPPALASAYMQSQAVRAADMGMLSLDPARIDSRYSFLSDNEVLVSIPDTAAMPAIGASTGISLVTVSGVTDLLFTLSTDPGVTMTLIAPNGTEITSDNYNTAPVSPAYQVNYSAETLYEVNRNVEPVETSLSRVRFIPMSQRTEMQVMNVVIDGATLLTGIGMDVESSTDYLLLTPGDHTVEFVSTASSTHIVSQTITTEVGKSYTLVAAGKDAPSLHWIEDDNNVPANPNRGRLRFVQSAQIAEAVNVYIDGQLVVNGAGFGQISGYIPVTAGDRLVEIQDAATDTDLVPPAIIDMDPATINTIYFVDWTADGYKLDWAHTQDESYLHREYSQFSVDQATPGDWKVKLTGDLATLDYLLLVNGLASPTAVSNVTAQTGAPDKVDVDLTLRSDYIPVTVTVYLSPEPITETLTYTDTSGTPVTEVVPYYTGFPVGETAITDPTQATGGAVQMQIDTANVPSGQYHVWVRADNGEMPPGSAFANQPGTSTPALITVDHSSTFPTTWTTPITPALNSELFSLGVNWGLLNHPDIDYYNLLIGTATLSYTEVISNLVPLYNRDSQDQPIEPGYGAGVVSNMRPGVTYYIAVEAVDEESGRTVRSQEKSISFAAGDYSIQIAKSDYSLTQGQRITIPVTIDPSQPLFFPGVAMGLTTEGLVPGILVYYAGHLDAPPVVDTSIPGRTVNLVVDVRGSVRDGVYKLVVNAYNGDGLNRSHTITLRIGNSSQVFLPTLLRETYRYTNDFQQDIGQGWSITQTSTTPNGDLFLGELGNTTATLTLNGLPAHSSLEISFDLYVLRSWDGNQETAPTPVIQQYRHLAATDAIGPDRWRFGVDGAPLLDTTFSNWPSYPQAYPDPFGSGDYPGHTGATEVNSLGYYFFDLPQDSVYHLSFVTPHTADRARLDFSALGLQPLEDESWGIDNVQVAVR